MNVYVFCVSSLQIDSLKHAYLTTGHISAYRDYAVFQKKSYMTDLKIN